MAEKRLMPLLALIPAAVFVLLGAQNVVNWQRLSSNKVQQFEQLKKWTGAHAHRSPPAPYGLTAASERTLTDSSCPGDHNSRAFFTPQTTPIVA